MLQEEVYVNVFYNDNGLSEIYSVYNASRETVTGPLFCIERYQDENCELHLEELWEKDESFVRENGIISGILEPEKIYILKITRRKKG